VNVSLEKKNDLNAILTIEIKPEDYLPKVEENLKEYRQKAVLPGFRKGMAPKGMVKKMVGKAIFVEEVNKLANDALFNYLKENEVDILGQPLTCESKESVIDFDKEGDFIFYFDLGLSPQFELNFTSKDVLTRYEISIDKKAIDEEIDGLRKRYGTLQDSDKSKDDQDTLKFNLTELDGKGNLLDGGVAGKESTVLIEIVKDKDTKKKLLGLKAGDTIEVDIFKLFNDNENVIARTVGLPPEGVKDLNKQFSLEVIEIKSFKPADLNQVLFAQVFGEDQVHSEEDFRAKLEENLKSYYAAEAENHVEHEIDHLMMDNHPMNLPDEFLKRWLKDTYPETYTEEATEEQYSKESDGLKRQLIREKIMEAHKVEVTEEDINSASYGLTTQMMRQYGMSNPDFETIRYFEAKNREDKGYMRQIRDVAVNRKVTQTVKGLITIKSKETTVEKFYDMIRKHNEKHNH
jgi:trigger factor